MACRLNMATVTLLGLLSVVALSAALQAPSCNASQILTPSSLTCIACAANSIADASGLLMFDLENTIHRQHRARVHVQSWILHVGRCTRRQRYFHYLLGL